jgi:hypothetical protein
LGPFLSQAITVLAAAGQVRSGDEVRIGHAPAPPRAAAIVFPPADPTAVGAVNRGLAAAGVRWRFGQRVEREDTLAGAEMPEVVGQRVRARHRLEGQLADTARGVLARAGDEPWLVRDGGTVLVGSRMVEPDTPLPLSAGFVPFVEALVNRVARGEAGIVEATPGDPVRLPERVAGMVLARDTVRHVEPGGVTIAPLIPGAFPLLAGGDTVAMLVVGADPRESDLTRLTAEGLRAALPGAQVTVTNEARGYAAARFRGAGRSELTGWLLVAALVALLVEPALAAGGVFRRA